MTFHLTQTCGEIEKYFETNPGINILELEVDASFKVTFFSLTALKKLCPQSLKCLMRLNF